MPLKVLYVEDEADVRLVIGEGLKYLEMDVTTVKDAEEALRKLRFVQPDVILLDMTLPGMSGWDFAKKLKLGSYRDIPIIAITGASGVGDEQKAYQVGCVGYIAKPCEPSEVKRKIEESLEKNRKI